MKTITVNDLASAGDKPLIDVREADEYAAGHIPGAINVPLSTLGENLDKLPTEAFDVVCQLGGRSARAVEALEAQGFDATNVEGGTSAWVESGHPLEA
ncbi:rhodanese-like domain-containing protein [uncultured Microbacterium sp.]|uniref:rhodanese-like domain-containing protein n=1 Tax=uncultured Microbacterium sp. TaxID=191216 RepID=UPI0025CEFD72|nr:rhodanese-like domain-containing protein [uncultured Microbacterium sp.]